MRLSDTKMNDACKESPIENIETSIEATEKKNDIYIDESIFGLMAYCFDELLGVSNNPMRLLMIVDGVLAILLFVSIITATYAGSSAPGDPSIAHAPLPPFSLWPNELVMWASVFAMRGNAVKLLLFGFVLFLCAFIFLLNLVAIAAMSDSAKDGAEKEHKE